MAAACALALASPARGAPPGRDLHLTYPAPHLGRETRGARVYLPPSYANPAARARRYPVVYLLHGFPGGSGDWLTRGHAGEVADSLAANGAIPELILVCPDGDRGFFGRSMWADRWDGGFPLATSLVRDLVPWVDAHFRTVPDAGHRAVIGLSDGANGGLNLMRRFPGTFSAWGGHSGEYRLVMDFGMGGVVGPAPGSDSMLRELSPLETFRARADVPAARALYLDCGRDDDTYAENLELHRRWDSLGVAHEWHEFPGSHQWSYWRSHLPASLTAVCRGLRVEEAP